MTSAEVSGNCPAALTRDLARHPGNVRLAVRLAGLARAEPGRCRAAELDHAGLLAAMQLAGVDRQVLSELAIGHLERTSAWGLFGARLLASPRRHRTTLALEWLVPANNPVLNMPLLLAALACGFNVSLASEAALTGLRGALLQLWCESEDVYCNHGDLLTALVEQQVLSEYVLPISKDERVALRQITLCSEGLQSGDAGEIAKLLVSATFLPLDTVLRSAGIDPANVDPDVFAPASPGGGGVGELLRTCLSSHSVGQAPTEREMAASGVTAAVQSHYRAHPYPRWTADRLAGREPIANALARYFAADELALLEGEPRILVAGCGTGYESCLAAKRYGEQAKVIGLDLSSTSIAYAERMADTVGLANVAHRVADLAEIALEPHNFDVIETTGVLHHTSRPRQNLARLVTKLRPGGFLRLGLYSRHARQSVAYWRSNPANPGPLCNADDARAFRALVADSIQPDRGMNVTGVRDFYTLNQFYDLLLNPHEISLDLTEIEAMLDENNLEFRGFALASEKQAAFFAAYPEDRPPGTLQNWASFEQRHEALFAGMYNLWCYKRPN